MGRGGAAATVLGSGRHSEAGTDPLTDDCCLCRMVIRIMIMVPLYSISSLVSLVSLEAAFVIDVIRDIYEVCC